jgi:cytidine deaminase
MTGATPGKPELVIAFVAPTGTSFDAVAKSVDEALALYDFRTVKIRLSDYLDESAALDAATRDSTALRIAALQKEGNRLRRDAKDAAILARVAVQEIRRERAENHAAQGTEPSSDVPVPGLAYLVWSLKHPDEAALLRGIYGSHFVLLSVFAPEKTRVETLAKRFCRDRTVRDPSAGDREEATRLVRIDEYESADSYGQRVRSVFPEADFFVDADDIQGTVQRAVDVLFGDPFATPTRDEYGMFMAHAASLRSAEMGRQVGAAIAEKSGEVVALGVNEVPRPGGGQYWPGDDPDHREFTRGMDTSDERKRDLADSVIQAVVSPPEEESAVSAVDEEAATAAVDALMKQTGIRDLIEFGRAVHAEMGALTDASRRGVTVRGATLFVTTFPCHHCARHVVASGIDRVVFIHPYPKSLAMDLHSDAIELRDYEPGAEKVAFESFRGVAPRQYMTLFTMSERKAAGVAMPRDDPNRWPKPIAVERERAYQVNAYLQREALITQEWESPPQGGDGHEQAQE